MTRNSVMGAGALIFVNAASGATTITYHVSHSALWALSAGFVIGILATSVAYYVGRELLRRHISSAAETLSGGRDDAPTSAGRHGHRVPEKAS